MAKGYIIVRMTVTDPEAYKEYAAMASEAMKLYGCKPWSGAAAAKPWKARPARATSCSNSSPTRRPGPIIIRRNTKPPSPSACRREPAKWCWSRAWTEGSPMLPRLPSSSPS